MQPWELKKTKYDHEKKKQIHDEVKFTISAKTKVKIAWEVPNPDKNPESKNPWQKSKISLEL